MQYIAPDRDVNNVIEFLEEKIEMGELKSIISDEDTKRIFELYKDSKGDTDKGGDEK